MSIRSRNHFIRLLSIVCLYLLGNTPSFALPDCGAIQAGDEFSFNTTVTAVTPVDAASGIPAYCQVDAIVRNDTDELSDINIRVQLPATGWNGKFLGLGNGGFAGAFQGNSAAGLTKGYAVAQTDTGHSAITRPGGTFAVVDPAAVPLVANHIALEDFGHRSIHLMTLVGKKFVDVFYGDSPEHSYYNGCSTGGRQGAMEMQRYPDDYDGVIIGAPLFSLSRKQLWAAWHSQNFHFPPTNISAAQRTAINDAILKACDQKDGLRDGILDDPRQCDWDPAEIQCGAGDDPASCLTPAQVMAVRNLYRGPVTDSGLQLYPPHTRGGELNWFPWLVGTPAGGPGGIQFANGADFMRFMVFLDAGFNFLTDFDINDPEQLGAVDSSLAAQVSDATNPDITPFLQRGGKTIMYHGWYDNGFTPVRTIEYYEDMERVVAGNLGPGRAGELVRDSARLFLVPGMNHCGGGPGPTGFDMLTALEQWVEEDAAPDSVIGTNPVSGLSRPLCPYPKVARYISSRKDVEAINDAENFVCVLPGRENAVVD